ncbi:MAG: phosphonate ABC transporter ATP-binding protein [Planctomycetota bacterium]
MISRADISPDIEFRSVERRFGDQRVLGPLDLGIERGAMTALIGPSGAGKTTFLRLAAGLDWPSSGSVFALGQETGSLRGKALRRLRSRIGMIHQSDNLIPGLRVVHNVLMGRLGSWSFWRSLSSLLRPIDLPLAREALRKVGLEERLWALPQELSGGEQQRVAVARLLVQAPRLVLADEPVSSLDQKLGKEILRMLGEFRRRQGATVAVSLHALDLLGEGFDRVIALRAGRIAWEGTVSEIDRATLRDIYGAEYRPLHLDELPIVPA